MKFEVVDENNYIIYLNKYYLNNMDFKNKISLEDYFKNLFLKIDKRYDIKMTGFCEIEMYLDNNYGAIIEIYNEDEEFYFNSLDIQVHINNTEFLYELLENIENEEIYKYKDKLYLRLKENTSYIDVGRILENTKIKYKDTEKIIKCGTIVK